MSIIYTKNSKRMNSEQSMSMPHPERMRFIIFFLLSLIITLTIALPARSLDTPVEDSHINRINELLLSGGINGGFAELDQFGRVQLKGAYEDEREVDRAFSVAQTVVGIKWVSPVTPENIKVKEWERRFGNLFSRANVLKPVSRGDDPPGPIRNRYALVVGVGEFMSTIPKLHFAVQDANTFYQFLIDPGRGGFPRSNVTFLTNQNATKKNISMALERLKRMAGPDDLVAVYMSSHGTPPEKFGGVFIVTYDTEIKPREKVWHTSISESILRDFIENMQAKRLVMILDACYSNGAYSKVPGFLPPGGKSLGASDTEGYGISPQYGRRLLGAKDIVLDDESPKITASARSKSFNGQDGWGRVLIGASGAGEQSWESDQLNNSIFTYYFLEGLNKNNGAVKNAFYYAKPRVTQRVKQEKGNDIDQNPQVVASKSEWNMQLAQKRRY
jgi:hypothetical protein